MIHQIDFDYLPPTMNEFLAAANRNRHVYGKLKAEHTSNCAIIAHDAPKFPGRVWIACHWRIKNIKRDPADNTPSALKFILDGLVQAGVITDDSGMVIQPPVIHGWEKSKDEGVLLTIADHPIYQLTQWPA